MLSRYRDIACLLAGIGIVIGVASCGVSAIPQPNGPSGIPSACPSPNNIYPPLDCAQYTSAGTQTVTFTRSFPTPTEAPTTLDWALSANTFVHERQTFHAQVATEFASSEIAASVLQTITTTDNEYYMFPQSSGDILDIGYHSTDSNGVVLDVQNGTGNGIVGQLPGFAPTWSNDAAQIVAENDPDGSTSTQTFNDDGSYTLSKTEAAGTTSATLNSDGSGTATIPSNAFFNFVGTGTILTISTPNPAGFIDYTLTSVGVPSPSPTPTPIVIVIPAWYERDPVLASDETTNLNTQLIPASCNLPPTIPSSGIHLHEFRTALDTVFGITETVATDRWIAQGVGPACEQISDAAPFRRTTISPARAFLSSPTLRCK